MSGGLRNPVLLTQGFFLRAHLKASLFELAQQVVQKHPAGPLQDAIVCLRPDDHAMLLEKADWHK